MDHHRVGSKRNNNPVPERVLKTKQGGGNIAALVHKKEIEKMKLTLEQLIAARNALEGPYETITMEDIAEEFKSEDEAAESLKLDIRDALLRDDIRRGQVNKLEKIGDLFRLYNSLVEDEEEHLDWYHLMDVMDNEDEVIESLTEEIAKLKNSK